MSDQHLEDDDLQANVQRAIDTIQEPSSLNVLSQLKGLNQAMRDINNELTALEQEVAKRVAMLKRRLGSLS